MNELLSDTRSIALALLAVIMSLLTFLGKRHLKRIDVIEDSYVTRDDLDKTLTQMREDRLRMHEENLAAGDRVATDVQYIRTRVDAISDRQR